MKASKIGLRLLTVSSENRCRSVLAEYAMRRAWAGRGFQVCSSGLDASDGLAADVAASTAALSHGISALASHRSRRLNESMLREADLVLVMETFQQHELLARLPTLVGRVHRLGRWRNVDICSPASNQEDAALACLRLIQGCVEDWQRRLEATGLLHIP